MNEASDMRPGAWNDGLPRDCDGKVVAICIIPNCGRTAPRGEAFCRQHRDDDFPKPKHKAPGASPCGECHIQPGETCDICGVTSENPYVWIDPFEGAPSYG